MAKAQINSSSLDNVKKQFKQDSLLLYKGYVYSTDLQSMQYAKMGMPVDKEGFPTPVSGEAATMLVAKMEEQFSTARRLFIERVSKLEAKSLASERVREDEHAE